MSENDLLQQTTNCGQQEADANCRVHRHAGDHSKAITQGVRGLVLEEGARKASSAVLHKSSAPKSTLDALETAVLGFRDDPLAYFESGGEYDPIL